MSTKIKTLYGAGATILASTLTYILISIAGQDDLIKHDLRDFSGCPWRAPVQWDLLRDGLSAYAWRIDAEHDSVVYTKSNMKFDSVSRNDSVTLIPSEVGWKPDSIRVYKMGWVYKRTARDSLILVNPREQVYEKRDVKIYRWQPVSDVEFNVRPIDSKYTMNLLIKQPAVKDIAGRTVVRTVPAAVPK